MLFCDETLFALHTLKRSLASMRAHMCLEITKLGELLHAMTEGADEDLGIALGPLDLPYLS